MARYNIGTSGWHYDHWRGLFYPDGLPKSRWFEYYARHFLTVELNNSFYRQPKASAWQAWHDEAPSGFRFAVKANRFLTHIKRFKDAEEPLKNFFDGAHRLNTFLGPVLYQAPPSFPRTEENVERLEAFFQLLPCGDVHVVEFRHNSWFVDDTLELLRHHNVGLCVHDMKGMRCPKERTSNIAYVRLHGGHRTYAGNYSDNALDEWAEVLERLTHGGHEAWVYFNNDLEGHAVHNAQALSERLGIAVGA